MARKKKYPIFLTDDEVKMLRGLLRKKDISQTVCNRCRILLDLDENHLPTSTYKQSANAHGICIATVTNTVTIYTNKGLQALLKLKRSANSNNARRKVDGRIEAKIIQIACGPVPEGHSRWTIRLLEDRMKIELEEPISREAIRRSLKKTGLDLTVVNTGACRLQTIQNL